jgi:hypothetical protein
MSDNAPASPPEVSRLTRIALNEDWAATIVGLLLLVLILAGVVTKGLVP